MKKNTTPFLLIFLLFGLVPGAFAQLSSPAPNAPSPNAASLGLYNQVPVDLFSGLPTVSIPIYELQDGAVKMPISLSYHPTSVKPENHPGWTGLGWNLSVGGSITRVVNSAPDEVANYANGDLSKMNILSYYYNPTQLNGVDWYSNTTLEAISRSNASSPVPNPDEFIFNFNGYQGSFYFNHQGKWVVKTGGNHALKIAATVQNDFKLRCDDDIAKDDTADGDEKTLKQIFHQFTLTTENGTQYTFGGVSNSIEFSRRVETLEPFCIDIIPTTWNLTKIVYPTGEIVTLTYIRKGCAFTQSVSSSISAYKLVRGNGEKRSTTPDNKSITNLYPVYLTEITSPTKKITFDSQRTNELKYTFDPKIKSYSFNQKNIPTITWCKVTAIHVDEKNAPSSNAPTISFAYTDQPNQRLTLKEVNFGEVNGNQKRYRFSYSGVPLPDYNSQMLDHWGFYNGVNFFKKHLPADGIGYTKSQSADYTDSREPDPTWVTAGLLTKVYYPTGGYSEFEWEPHQYAAVATKYPFGVDKLTSNQTAGGARIHKIFFKEYEDTPLLVKEYLYQTNYINTSTGLSSGILGGKPRYLEEGTNDGTEYYWYWNDYSIEPLSYTNGNHVTYSEVIEKSASDNGFTVYTYSNHNTVGDHINTEYQDQPYKNGAATSDGQWRFDPFISLELERGNLLSKEEYNAGKKIQASTIYHYNEDPTRFETNIRAVDLKQRSFPSSEYNPLESRATATYIYTYPNFVSKQTNAAYQVDGTNPVVTETMYGYTDFNSVRSTSTTASNGAARVVTYRYPADYAATAMGGAMGDLQTKYLHDRVIEERVNENALTIGGKVNQYNRDGQLVSEHLLETLSPVASMPTSATNVIPNTTLYKPRTTLTYDANKNLASYQLMGDVPTSYLWGYANTLLIANVKNARPTQVFHTSFEDASTNVSSESQTGKKSCSVAYTVPLPPAGGTFVLTYWQKVGTNNWTLVRTTMSAPTAIGGGTGVLIDEVRVFPKGAEMSTYTYDPLLGLTSSTDANNVTTYYEYDRLQRLQYLKDQDKNIVKSFLYHFKD